MNAGPPCAGVSYRGLRQHPARLTVLWLAGLASLASLEASAAGFSRIDFPTASAPIALAVGDLNRDGKPDLVTANIVSNDVSVLLGDGAGGYGFSRSDFPAGIGPVSVAIADLNGDGKPDLAIANREDGSISILLNATQDGDELTTFVVNDPAEFAVGLRPYWVVVGDINLDGRPDLISANFADNTVSVLLNATLPGSSPVSFQPRVDFPTGDRTVSVAVGDLNGDGRPDVATANYTPNTVSVLLNSTPPGATTPSFLPNLVDFPAGETPGSIAIADLDGNGKPDLVTGNYDSHNVTVLLNTMAAGATTPSFDQTPDLAVGGGSSAVVTGDLNRDGRPDVTTANYDVHSVTVLVNTSTQGSQFPAFVPRSDFTTGNNPIAIVIGDLDVDGRLDLATTNYGSNTGTVLLNSLSEATGPVMLSPVAFATGNRPTATALRDLNHDGRLDLVTANRGSGDVSVLLGDGSGAFGASTEFAAGDEPVSVAIGDLDRDGHPDVVTANRAGTVSVLLGRGDGTLGANTDFAAGGQPAGVDVGDLNRDGVPDIVVANSDDNSVSVLLGTGTGALGAKTDFAAGTGPSSVAIGDVNRDGRLDVAVANADGEVSVLLGDGAGSFAAPVPCAVGGSPSAVAIGDVSGDGKPDLAVTNAGSGTVSVLLGDGTGAFVGRTDYATGTSPAGVAVGDVNGDAKADLVVANTGDHSVSVLVGTGNGGMAPRIDIASDAGTHTVVIGDVNGDGRPDVVAGNDNAGTVSVLVSTTPFVSAPESPRTVAFALGPIAPNPSRQGARISFALPRQTTVRLRVLDIQGREVATLADGVYPAGRHDVLWGGARQGRLVTSGLYFVRYDAGGASFVQRLVVTR
jgi:hypothetical protein